MLRPEGVTRFGRALRDGTDRAARTPRAVASKR